MILVGRNSDILAQGMAEDVVLAVWCRELSPHLRTWLDVAAPEQLPQGRAHVGFADIASAMRRMFLEAGTIQDAAAASLLDDIVALATNVCHLLAVPSVDIRLDVIRGDACWKFHRDRVPARFVTTYRGPATQWVHPRDGDAALAMQREYSGPVRSLSTGDVALFKGSLAKNLPGVVHRSPPIAGTGNARLLCAIDPPGPASPDLWQEGSG